MNASNGGEFYKKKMSFMIARLMQNIPYVLKVLPTKVKKKSCMEEIWNCLNIIEFHNCLIRIYSATVVLFVINTPAMRLLTISF